ncbi:SDR family NAD(P)-dependent oxidoreductase [Angustibacter luteus]|uniref:SDR family NAD(P)-dependent oxidoreductase n=1 Tax=Angustibacter luteus TaxID=658456 RepID=A0ABW1JC35_9ACTN
MTADPAKGDDATPRVVLVTGATSGIGLALARELAAAGDHLALLARSKEPLDRTASECRTAGAASVTTFAADVADGAAVEAAVRDVERRQGPIDVVVQSAGVAAYGRFEDVPPEVFDGVLATNVLGTANVVRAVLPGMRDRNDGRIVLIGSVVGALAVPEMSAYAVSKWAIRSLARHLQIENRDRSGVHITLVTPGGIDTPIYPQAATYNGHVGKPPPPIYAPETVAHRIVQSLNRPPKRLDVGITNAVMALGFALLPSLYDAIVTPLFNLVTKERENVPPTSGNVLRPNAALNALRGRHPGLTNLRRR